MNADEPDARSQTPAAERMRRHRRRRRSGLRCFMVQIRETEIDELTRRGMLKDETRNDPAAVVEALYTHLDRSLTAKS